MNTQDRIELSDIPGLGPVRLQALAEVGVRDLEGLLALKVRELSEIRGIGVWQARKIREFLRHRGLLVEADDDGSVVLVPPCTAAQEEALERSVHAMEAQAEAEARVEAEVEALARAVAEAQRQAEVEGASPASNGKEAAESKPSADRRPAGVRAEGEPSTFNLQLPGAASGDRGEAAESAVAEEEPVEGGPDWREEISVQREQLPETALQLIEAIRQAAVTKQLTRQITRLLITAGEFVSDSRPLSEGRREEAHARLEEAGALLSRAMQRREFSPDDQKALAQRIRRRRKDLERLLEHE